MTTPARPGKSRLSLVLLVGASVLLLLLIACGSASQPAEEAAPAGSAQQVEPTAASAPAPVVSGPAVESAPASQPAQTNSQVETIVETGVDAAKADNTQPQAEEPAAEPKMESIESIDPTAAPAAPETTEIVAAAETVPATPMESKEPTSAQETVAPTGAPTGDPDPAPAVGQVEPTVTGAPAVQEPLPEIGNRVGSRIPDFTLELADGATVTSASLVGQGRPTFLFFFATT
jgi:hypothetical protein